MNIFYWCPFLSKVATVQAVINSAISLKKYSKNKISPHIINAIGEWDDLQNLINENIRYAGKFKLSRTNKEDCEHRSFHINAVLKNKAKIRISPHCLFV